MLARAPKQQERLMKYISMSGVLGSAPIREVSKRELLESANATAAALNGLVDKKILTIYYHEVGRLEGVEAGDLRMNPLNQPQQSAFNQINDIFQTKSVCLLHGVTSSGKTEVYIHLIDEMLRKGKQVLYLLPEIALTTQITERLKRAFGSRLGVYHSKFPDAERVEIWRKQLSDQPYDIILGVRSSIFLPLKNLGLIVVDEEYENT